MTNAEMIRSLTDMQIAHLIDKASYGYFVEKVCKAKCTEEDTCLHCTEDWATREAIEEDYDRIWEWYGDK